MSEAEVVISDPDGAGIPQDDNVKAAIITAASVVTLNLFMPFSFKLLPAGGYTVSSMYLLLFLIHVLIRPFEDIFK